MTDGAAFRLSEHVAIVTGAGSSGPGVGIGRAIAVVLARAGARVVLVDRVRERAVETEQLIAADGGESLVIAADVTDPTACEAIVDAAVKRFGGLHVLVNSVGVVSHGDLLAVTADDWDESLAVNLKSMMLMSKYAVPPMVAGGGGSIVNIGSTGAVRPPGGHVAYDAAKGGVAALTISIAVEQGANGIRANCVMPGRAITPLGVEVGRLSGHPEEELNAYRARNLLHTIGDAWDVAYAALFLASDEARWITSVMLPVDGGFLHTPP